MSAPADRLYHLADLASWDFPGVALAVLGHPVAHSLSPPMHNAALAELARAELEFHHWRYFKFDIDPAQLPEALPQFHRRGFRGLNLTVPHKSIVIPLLAGADSFVTAAGAANTLRATPDGWVGANTDGYGLAMALRETLGAALAGAHVVLLGAGGAARGAAVECLHAGCAGLWIGNRTRSTLETLRTDLTALPGADRIRLFDLAHPGDDLPAGAWVINATSLGLKPDEPAPIDLAKISRPAGVFDMIYRPAVTSLLRQAAALGIAHANGLAMLVHQGVRSLELWTGRPAPVATMSSAVHRALQPSAS